MPREDDKIVSLDQRREQEADRKRAQAMAERDARRRRQLAEHGPAAERHGRLVGRILLGLLLVVLVAAVTWWVMGFFS
ncbi:hypothetical protein [Caulobacter sp. NIBR1757]|uniref:hypothetical protein n=1 Tax=Caulobacter sp. NIBR1757 TaxID=3016000 RepID=UPI0022F1357D|nr:hypothetical protein [Caulobacter sp. NIBR1757]WGM39305.1 hypothetical protein AMEJIAPC_02223 [Caulobacter sp. NIBR1757]